MAKHSVEYFIEYFKQVEEEQMVLTAQTNVTSSVPMGDAWEWLTDDEQDSLYEIIMPYGMLIHVNDGVGMWRNVGDTPKKRVLAFLEFIRKAKEHIA